MDEAIIKNMATELAKGLKTPEDLNQMTAIFKKFMIETALNTELSEHLGYEKHQPKKGSNARNGFSSKTVLTQDGIGIYTISKLCVKLKSMLFNLTSLV